VRSQMDDMHAELRRNQSAHTVQLADLEDAQALALQQAVATAVGAAEAETVALQRQLVEVNAKAQAVEAARELTRAEALREQALAFELAAEEREKAHARALQAPEEEAQAQRKRVETLQAKLARQEEAHHAALEEHAKRLRLETGLDMRSAKDAASGARKQNSELAQQLAEETARGSDLREKLDEVQRQVRAVQCSAVQCSAVQCSAVQCSAAHAGDSVLLPRLLVS
jgi:ATP-dependent Lon protease